MYGIFHMYNRMPLSSGYDWCFLLGRSWVQISAVGQVIILTEVYRSVPQNHQENARVVAEIGLDRYLPYAYEIFTH
jgi:hypothetical protein